MMDFLTKVPGWRTSARVCAQAGALQDRIATATGWIDGLIWHVLGPTILIVSYITNWAALLFLIIDKKLLNTHVFFTYGLTQ
jgi:hypothetical protein